MDTALEPVVPSQEAALSKGLRDRVAGRGALESDGCDCIITIALFFLLWSMLGSFKVKEAPDGCGRF